MRGITRNTEERAQILAAFRDSGLSVSTFAAQAGVANSTFYQWLQRERVAAVGVPMVRVVRKQSPMPFQRALVPPKAKSGVSMELGGVRVAVERDFDRATLEAVLAVLGAKQTDAR